MLREGNFYGIRDPPKLFWFSEYDSMFVLLQPIFNCGVGHAVHSFKLQEIDGG